MSTENLSKEQVIELAARYVCPARINTFKLLGAVSVMAKREGHYFWDMDGRKLFDVHINGGTYNLGHRNPEIIATLRAALDEYDIGNHHFASGPRARLAKLLAGITPGNMRHTVFAASGSEAVEVAIRSARKATGKRRIVAFAESYHGHGGLSLRAGGYQKLAGYFLSEEPVGEFIQVPFNDIEAMEEALAQPDVAAVISEMIPATSGFPMPDQNYHAEVGRLCKKYGVLYIADEVQTGLGRTGRMWACEGYGVEPDILVTGKGLSGGVYPIAAAVMTEQASGWIQEEGWGHSSTFGGSELGCLVAEKVIEIITRPGLLENVRAMSEFLRRGLEDIRSRYPFFEEIRQNGLVMGLRFGNPIGGAMMMGACYEAGLWAFVSGFNYAVLQFKPNLLVDRAACEEVLGMLEKALEIVKRRSPPAGA